MFSSELASSFIDSEVGLVLSVWFNYLYILNRENKFIVVYRRLLTNRLHGKAAELCLANS